MLTSHNVEQLTIDYQKYQKLLNLKYLEVPNSIKLLNMIWNDYVLNTIKL